MTPPDPLPQGAPYAIGAVIVDALRADADLAGVVIRDNPLRLEQLQAGDRIVFYEDVSDRFIEQNGNVQKRTFGWNIGVINRAPAARQGAHADYRIAKRIARGAIAALNDVLRTQSVRELDVTYRLENIDVGGGLVLGSFSVEYRDPS